MLLFNNAKAREILSKGKVALGADLTVTAGSTDASKSAQTAMSDVYSYSRSGGAFVGALLEGTTINADEGSLKSFYGEQATIGSTLASSNIPPERAMLNDFVKSLPTRG